MGGSGACLRNEKPARYQIKGGRLHSLSQMSLAGSPLLSKQPSTRVLVMVWRQSRLDFFVILE